MKKEGDEHNVAETKKEKNVKEKHEGESLTKKDAAAAAAVTAKLPESPKATKQTAEPTSTEKGRRRIFKKKNHRRTLASHASHSYPDTPPPLRRAPLASPASSRSPAPPSPRAPPLKTRGPSIPLLPLPKLLQTPALAVPENPTPITLFTGKPYGAFSLAADKRWTRFLELPSSLASSSSEKTTTTMAGEKRNWWLDSDVSGIIIALLEDEKEVGKKTY